jgi:hypothetical protein
MQVEMPL